MRSLEQLDRWIAAKVKAWSLKAAGGPPSMDLLEIRREILHDIRDHIQRKGEGKNLFPYNMLQIHIAAADGAQQALLEGAFSEDKDLEQSISELLREADCPVPAPFSVAVSVTENSVTAGTARPFHIDYSHVKATAANTDRHTRPNAALTVLRGQAEPSEYTIHSDRVNLGRLKEVISTKDGLRRRNDIAFAETETTVSREHAYLRYDPASGKFRLYDAMSQHGTVVFREGRRFAVPKGPAHGFQLRSGDEIHLGDARLQFSSDEPSQ
jgi:FHA domain